MCRLRKGTPLGSVVRNTMGAGFPQARPLRGHARAACRNRVAVRVWACGSAQACAIGNRNRVAVHPSPPGLHRATLTGPRWGPLCEMGLGAGFPQARPLRSHARAACRNRVVVRGCASCSAQACAIGKRNRVAVHPSPPGLHPAAQGCRAQRALPWDVECPHTQCATNATGVPSGSGCDASMLKWRCGWCLGLTISSK
jgi:hypothetical protein